MSNNTASTARPQAVIADWKARSRISPPDTRKSGAARGAGTDVSFAVSSGYVPGISGRENAGLAIPLTLANSCYKGVKIRTLFQRFRLPAKSIFKSLINDTHGA